MCAGECKCGGKCGSNADGPSNYDPKQVAVWINKYIPQPTVEQAKASYPLAMVYLEQNNLQPTEENIKANAEAIKNAIENPDSLNKEPNDNKFFLGVVASCIVIIILIRKFA